MPIKIRPIHEIAQDARNVLMDTIDNLRAGVLNDEEKMLALAIIDKVHEVITQELRDRLRGTIQAVRTTRVYYGDAPAVQIHLYYLWSKMIESNTQLMSFSQHGTSVNRLRKFLERIELHSKGTFRVKRHNIQLTSHPYLTIFVNTHDEVEIEEEPFKEEAKQTTTGNYLGGAVSFETPLG